MVSRYFNISIQNSYILLGPRQTGKSYYIKSLNLPKLWSVNLLLSRSYLKYSKNPSLFRDEALHQIQKNGVETIFVDEIQKLPILLDEVHQLIEETSCRFILTGSSARKLKRGSANLLAGRALLKRLYPLIYPEIKESLNVHLIDELLQFGSVAGIYQKPAQSRASFLRSYINTYLKEEIQMEGLTRGLPSFSHFLDVAAQTFGETLNYSKIGRDCSQNANTTRNYFEILEDTLIGYSLPTWDESRRKQLASHPKFYFFDNGVTCALLSRLSDPLDASLRGRLFEQWIINEVRARFDYDERDLSLCYWKTQSGLEVDLIVARGKTPLFAVEIKSHAQIRDEHLNSLRELRLDYPSLPLYLVCTEPEPRTMDGISLVPWWIFLTEIVSPQAVLHR